MDCHLVKYCLFPDFYHFHIINHFPNDRFQTLQNLKKFKESSPDRKKILWEKEKLLVSSNFFFSHSVFKRLVLQTRKIQGLFGTGLTNFFAENKCGQGSCYHGDCLYSQCYCHAGWSGSECESPLHGKPQQIHHFGFVFICIRFSK